MNTSACVVTAVSAGLSALAIGIGAATGVLDFAAAALAGRHDALPGGGGASGAAQPPWFFGGAAATPEPGDRLP